MSRLDTGALSNQRRSWMVELKLGGLKTKELKMVELEMVELKTVELKTEELKTVANELGQQRNFDLGAVRQSLEGLASKAKGIEGHG